MCAKQIYMKALVAKVWFQKSRWVMVPLIHLREGPGVRKQLCAKFLGTLNLDDCPADESSNEFSLYRWNEVKSYFRNRNFWKSNNSLNLCILQAKLLWMSQKSFLTSISFCEWQYFPFCKKTYKKDSDAQGRNWNWVIHVMLYLTEK